jgi:hypothetical protein
MSLATPAPPPLPAEVERLLRRLRLPYVRKAAPEVLATAASQRWQPAEVLRVLLEEEAKGRDRAGVRNRRRPPACPPARPSRPGTSRPRRSQAPPTGAPDSGVDRPRRGALCLRPKRDRQEPLRRGARPPGHRARQDRRLAHARIARGAGAPPPRRRHPHQGDRQADPLRSRDRRRRWHAARLARRGRGALPGRRRRLRAALARADLKHPSLRL